MAPRLRYPPPSKEAAALGCGRIAAEARAAQAVWAARPLRERLRTVRVLRHRAAAGARDLVRAAGGGGERPEAEVLSSEVVPLLDACRFLEREAAHLLSPRRVASEGRPFWLTGVDAEVRREPLGVVLLIAPSNYPLFLPGVQAVQALAAGNAVLWKPGRGGLPAARALAALAAGAGVDPRLLGVLPEEPEAARAALAAGVDKVLLTGSAATGRAVLAELAGRLVPATMELSGCDALFVLPGADLDRVARAVRFGLTLNAGATCIAPRRVFVPRAVAGELADRIAELAAALPAVTVDPEVACRARVLAAGALEGGARLLAGSLEPADDFQPLVVADALPTMRLLQEDLFAPAVSLVSVGDVEEALADDALCPYALAVSIFGPEGEARALAGRVRAGVVVINDVIVPTADPRLPFGGRGESGFGVTRGAEGLLDLTVPKVVAVRRGRQLPHLGKRHPEDAALFHAYLTLTHAGELRARFRGAAGLLRALIRRGRGA
ncbi:MAG TPA: aldehyde dehydrogenase family protein [Thermoanaerobaculia bacterium]|nr:aldehyde dehydrogenase family protein [Thermoanaerobaculia bacterium]